MIPLNELSPTTFDADFNYPVKGVGTAANLEAWELGGVNLNDNSQGMSAKIWYGTLVINKYTTIGSVYVTAPGSPTTLLFALPNVTEIDIAFDQNMNPFVAYVQAGVAKYYWHDPIALAMVHSSLPNTCRSPRCCFDEHRTFNADSSDILLCYVDGTTLKMRYQRDRYAIEYPLLTGVDESVQYVGMNKQSRIQFGLVFVHHIDYILV